MRMLMRPAPMAPLALLTLGSALPATPIAAQGPPDAAPKVEYIASIKRNTTGGGTIRMAPGTISAIGMPIRPLIRQAYGPLQDFQLVGGPDWIDADRFDIEARLESPPSQPMMQAMLRQLLAERFGLRVHMESRELPIYELMLARDDGRLGQELKPSAPDCVTMMTTQGRGRGAPLPRASAARRGAFRHRSERPVALHSRRGAARLEAGARARAGGRRGHRFGREADGELKTEQSTCHASFQLPGGSRITVPHGFRVRRDVSLLWRGSADLRGGGRPGRADPGLRGVL